MFTHFIDDAAVFPPGLAPLPAAVANHLKNDGLPAADYVGPLVLPLKDIAEAADLAADRDLTVSIVTPPGQLPAVTELLATLPPTVTVAAVELKVTADASADQDAGLADQLADAASFLSAHSGIAVWIELPAALVTADRLAWMEDHHLGLKFRTGGVTRSLYPSQEELLDVLGTALQSGIPFKLTAGLHRALRYSETVGDEQLDHFGFLNIAAAVAALREGRHQDAAALLASDDGTAVLDATSGDAWRDSFTSFGCCSVLESLTTLNELGAVDDGALRGLTEPTV